MSIWSADTLYVTRDTFYNLTVQIYFYDSNINGQNKAILNGGRWRIQKFVKKTISHYGSIVIKKSLFGFQYWKANHGVSI